MLMFFASLLLALSTQGYSLGSDREEAPVGNEVAQQPAPSQNSNASNAQKCCSCKYNWGINPSARECPNNKQDGYYGTAEWLFWRAEEDDVSLALKNSFTTVGNHGQIVRMNYEWDSGFRLGAGWNTPYDAWDFAINYTWYLNTSKLRINPLGTNSTFLGLDAFWMPNLGGTNRVNSLTARWDCKMQIGDAEVARDYFVGDKLSFRPYLGARFAEINRELTVNYGPQNSAGSPNLNTPGSVYTENNFWGIGPRFGVGGDWRLKHHFYLFGNVGTSLLYGHANGRYRVNQTFLGETVRIVDPTFWKPLSNIETKIGFGWGSCINCNRLLLSFQVAWEASQWFKVPAFGTNNQTDAVSIGATNSNRNLGTQGLTVSAYLGF
jgi:hypothetical protein